MDVPKSAVDEMKQLKSAHAMELECAVQAAVVAALREERARVAELAAAASLRQAQRSLWLRSPDCLLQVLCQVAFTGHPAWNFVSLTKAFRGDEVLWGCIKDRRGGRGRTLLMACARRGDLARVRWLLGRGAKVNAQTDLGETALKEACQMGHLDTVRELLGQGADMNAAEAGGKTALMCVCMDGPMEIVRELLGHASVSVNAAETSGMTALLWACRNGHVEAVRALLEWQGVGVGAVRVDAADEDGFTALMWACVGGHLEVVHELLGRQEGVGVDVSATDSFDGLTSLMWACHNGHLEVVRELLGRQGVDVNAAETDGTTSLMWACKKGYVEVARLLLAHHASVTAVDNMGRTAYQLTPAGHAELRELVQPPAA